MKILIVTSEFGLKGGGLSLSCHKLKELLSTQNEVFILDSSMRPVKTIEGGYSKELAKSIELEYKLKTDILDYNTVDVIIGFGGNINGYYASLLARKINVRFILCLRGSDVNLSKWSCVNSWYLQQSVSYAERVICLSKEMRDNVLLQSPGAEYKICIIPNNIIPLPPHCIRFNNLPDSLVIGCAASHLNEKKGIANLLAMVSEFKKISSTPIRIELVGDIDQDLSNGYKSEIQRLGIQANVMFFSKKNRSELSEIMKNWDFYIQSSVCEGHPNSIIEALQNGIPFISSRTGFLAENLYEKFPELFFKDFNPSVMAVQLKSLIELPEKEEIYTDVLNTLGQSCNENKVREQWENILTKNVPCRKLNVKQILAVGLHEVFGDEHDSITTPVQVFKKFVEKIYESGYGLCSMKKYVEKALSEREHWIVCTFDDGYVGLIKNALPILNQYGFSATVFVCTTLIGNSNGWNNKDAVKRQHLNLVELDELYSQGWEIASHGVHHYNLLKLSDEDVQFELEESKRFIEERWHYSMTYAYPYGAYNDFIKSCVGEYYQYAFAVTKGGTSLVSDNLQIRRYSITEIYKMLSIIP